MSKRRSMIPFVSFVVGSDVSVVTLVDEISPTIYNGHNQKIQ